MDFIPVQFIQNKKRGIAHSSTEIQAWIEGYTNGKIPDYQMSAWLMAVCFNSLNESEIGWLTGAMRDSGIRAKWSVGGGKKIDKHSTGGIGDKTSLILGPLAAAAGIQIPMIAGRGLGHTGGTLDKLESIPGFSVQLSFEEFIHNTEKFGLAIIGQTREICPADRKMYALRDVTGTVDSIPLICASIMSKKLAESLDALVLDVKFGSGAFMKTPSEAKALAKLLKTTGERNGVKVSAFLTSMNQPLGAFMGNALEVVECLDILQNKKHMHRNRDFYEDTRELSLALAAEMIFLGGKASDVAAARKIADHLLESGAAYEQFVKLCNRQAKPGWENIPTSHHSLNVHANRAGWIAQMDCERIGMAGIVMGAGRTRVEDPIDPTAGCEFLAKIGDRVEQGDPIFRLYGSDLAKLHSSIPMLQESIGWSDVGVDMSSKLILEVIRD